jgi:hypothetical protein
LRCDAGVQDCADADKDEGVAAALRILQIDRVN